MVNLPVFKRINEKKLWKNAVSPISELMDFLGKREICLS
jgi:hypothetical protein